MAGIITPVVGNGVGSYTGDGVPATSTGIGPVSAVMDKYNNIFICDNYNYRVRKVDAITRIITTIGGNGLVGYCCDGLPATSTTVNPKCIAVDNFGNVYVGDGSTRVRKINTSGIISTVVGTGVPGYSGDGGMADTARIYDPEGVTFDGCGNLYISDDQNCRVRVVTYPAAPPTFSITTLSDSFCVGSTVGFTAGYAVAVGGTAAYQWYVDGVAVAGATAGTYSYMPAGGDSVRCVLTFTSPCMSTTTVSSNSILLTAVGAVTPTVTLPPSPVYAAVGSTVTVNATVLDTPATYIINWYNRGVLLASTTTPHLSYTMTMAIDSITAHMAESEVCYDSAVSGVYVVVDSVLGVRGVAAAANAGLLLSPNPAGGSVTVTAPGYVQCITVTDITGRTLLVQPCGTAKATIDISALPAGTYFVKAGAWVGRLVKE